MSDPNPTDMLLDRSPRREIDETRPMTRQVVLFTVVLSFVVSVIGTILALGVLGPVFGFDDGSNAPFVFNKPGILERITERVTETEVQEKVVRQDELVVNVVEAAAPAVVSVVATRDVPVIERSYVDPFADDPFFREFFGDSGVRVPELREKGTQKREVSAGTGFIVSDTGTVITNKHVVSDTEAEYTVFLSDGSRRPAKVLARDPVNDIAILKIEGGGYSKLPLGDASSVKIGQSVIAIGNALGEFRNTVSVGVISGLRRSIIATGAGGTEALQELIQTDAAINPGNSGGPLINIWGEVVGINVAVAQGAQNIGFAIPADKVKKAIESVVTHGRIIYPFLGVHYMMVTEDLAEERKLGRTYGALVIKPEGQSGIVAGSPAQKAGLKEGDIILSFGGQRVDQEHTLAALIQKQNVGDEIPLTVFRAGAEITLKAVLEERK